MLSHLVDLLLGLALHSPVLETCELPLVLALEVEIQGAVNAHGKQKHADGGAVTGNVSRCGGGVVQEGRRDTRRVPDGDEDTTSEGTLAVTGLIDGNPGHSRTRTGPQTGRDEETADELLRGAAGCKQQSIANNHNGSTSNTEDTSLLNAITVHGDGQVDTKTDNVHRDGEGVDDGAIPVCVTHALDNGW